MAIRKDFVDYSVAKFNFRRAGNSRYSGVNPLRASTWLMKKYYRGTIKGTSFFGGADVAEFVEFPTVYGYF